ncbi:MAG: MarR family transcriptional regulator [Woeseiaceae bacterium]|nr:MarR family transcriptional regulator [Woeseiaceae bacterium]
MTNALKKCEAQEPIDLGVLAQLVGYQLHRAEIDSYRQFTSLFGKNSTSPKQFSALVLVAANPEMSQVDLGKVLGMDRATTTAMIDTLENRGLLMRQRSTVDRRKHMLRLTKRGEESLQVMKRRVREHDERLTSRLTSQERMTLMSLLKKIRTSDEML